VRGFFKFRNQVSRFAFLACAAAAAQLTDVSLAQNHCTAVTNLTAIPFGTNTCGSNYFTIRGTEVKGSHPVTANIGSTPIPVKGVCAYQYPGCLANQYFSFTSQAPIATAGRIASVTPPAVSQPSQCVRPASGLVAATK